MVNIEFEYKDKYTNGKWNKQSCTVSSVEECKRIYGLGIDCEYRIISVEEVKRMLKIIRERTPETITEYFIEFTYKDDPEAGFIFPALPNGEVDFNSMCREAKDNYITCLSNDKLTKPEFKVSKHTYINPAVGKCSCGKEVVLEGGYEGATQCECGRWYNLFGQSLIDPKYWYRDEDEYYSDMPED